MMIFNRRKKYNGRVAALLPAFGIRDSDTGVFSLLNTLDIAWGQKYREHEAALLVAYTIYGGMLKAGEPRAPGLIEKVKQIQDSWAQKGLVSRKLVAQFAAKESEWRKLHTTPSIDSSSQLPEPRSVSEIFMINLPDPDTSRPDKMFSLGHFTILYYEDTKSIGEVNSVPGAMHATRTAVVVVDNIPFRIIRYERGLLGTLAMTKIETDGLTSNCGTLSDDTISGFLAQVEVLAADGWPLGRLVEISGG